MKCYFWIQSSRGTEQIQLVTVPFHHTKEDIKYQLEDWCSHFGAWYVSENCVAYGWAVSTPSVRKKVKSYYNGKSQRSQKVNDLIRKKITPEQYSKWSKKNRKALQFPFK